MDVIGGFVRWGACALLTVGGIACSTEGEDLFVDIRTDLVAPVEFAAVEVVLFDEEDPSNVLDQAMQRIDADDDTLVGTRVARFRVPRGDWPLEVRALDARGAVVQRQPVVAVVRGTTGVTALLTRDCRDVECPAELGDPGHTACVAGQCVSPRCTAETPEECGAPTCAGDGDCGEAECGTFRCLEGFCYGETRTGTCAEGEYCAVEQGCQAIPTGVDADRDRYADYEDCDDTDPAVHPGATERCDGVDDDCDGVFDEGLSGQAYYPDADGDGFGTFADSVVACLAPEGFVERPGDCDDTRADVFPGAPELCDGDDNDCDLRSDDMDRDGHSAIGSCEGGALPADDCDDGDASVNPLAVEVCDSIDHDCSGDPQDAEVWFSDQDRDGYGGREVVCEGVSFAPVIARGGDCNDFDDRVNPDVETDACGGGDEDCDETLDEDPDLEWYVDGDGDGAGVGDPVVTACAPPPGHASATGDCNDTDATIAPGFEETCDGRDEDCDSTIDEDPRTAPADVQEGVCASTRKVCVDGVEQEPDYTALDGFEGDEISCDGRDNDCDGATDESLRERLFPDDDDDGEGSFLFPSLLCPSEGTADPSDCDDDDSARNSAAAETCDGVDDDCDGIVDEGDLCAPGELCVGTGCVATMTTPASFAGAIDTDTVWSGGVVDITGDVFIDSDVTLHLGPGTTLRMAAGAAIQVAGRLSARGDLDAAPVVFESASATPTRLDWQGLFGTGEIDLSGFIVRHAATAISDARATDCLLEENFLAARESSLRRCEVRNNDHALDASGVVVIGGPVHTVIGCDLHDNTHLVLRSRGRSELPMMFDTTIRTHDTCSGNFELIRGEVRECAGLHDDGPRVTPHATTTFETLYSDNLAAISPDVAIRTTFESTELLVSDRTTMTDCRVCRADGAIAVRNSGLASVDLPNVYWCTTDTAEIDAAIFDDADDSTLGVVNYTPFLTEHPAGAPLP